MIFALRLGCPTRPRFAPVLPPAPPVGFEADPRSLDRPSLPVQNAADQLALFRGSMLRERHADHEFPLLVHRFDASGCFERRRLPGRVDEPETADFALQE